MAMIIAEGRSGNNRNLGGGRAFWTLIIAEGRSGNNRNITSQGIFRSVFKDI